ncbi:MAG TPA: signal recognition particle-docking protein FtsY, partial [Candidatus Ozemobacteraceae bacterium]|nr:signal recognition particle-docking protein FtsY [Candidatus Ozemobacteraceae bacterium]
PESLAEPVQREALQEKPAGQVIILPPVPEPLTPVSPVPPTEPARPIPPVEEKPPAKPIETPAAPPPVAEKKVEPKPAEDDDAQLSWYDRLRRGLSKTRNSFVGKLKKLVFGTTKIDEDMLEELEETLFEADVGPKTTTELLEIIHKEVEKKEVKDPSFVYQTLRDELKKRLNRFVSQVKWNPDGLTVFLIIGVNGVGKTTTIAKLAHRFKKEGKNVVLAAGDTFRAAAIDQLGIWADRAGVEVIKGQEGGDPGALVFDAIHAARKRNANLLIVDTAGRMHVKANLMDELRKIRKIVEKEAAGPHETLLVLDANTGQNAIQQAKLFNEALPISGLVMTKLDGTAKGGVLFAVEEQLNVPVKFIGVGEKMNDLMDFNPDQFLEALFADDTDKSKQSDYNVL